jgi:hypothetical protein
VLFLTASCSKWLDVVVMNPCGSEVQAVVTWWPQPPSMAKARDVLDSFVAQDNFVPANADSFVLASEVGGDLPFDGGYGIARWSGSEKVRIFRVPPSDVEPVPVAIPPRFCA